ncbi:MAG TPA: SufE family protein [Anaerolineales bacterium]|nr:SufE family protein [Anaerolineales bacterium]
MALPPKLQEIVADFSGMSREEKLETLLAYAETLPDIPDRLRQRFDRMEDVPECMTPVRVLAERQPDGGLIYYFDIPPHSPTVRGLASLLSGGLNGSLPEEILAVPADFYLPMKLEEAITQQRITGFMGVLAHMKHIAVQTLQGS